MSEPLWKPIPYPIPLELLGQTIVGGWYTRGNWRVGVCTYVGGDTNAFLSDRSGVATHYVCALPIAPPAPAGRVLTADELDRVDLVRGLVEPDPHAGVVDASPDPLVTDWDGDPTGPPIV